MAKPAKFSPEVKERAVRLVLEYQAECASQHEAIRSVAGKIPALSNRPRARSTGLDCGGELG
jgi:transposase-like protein